MELSAKEIERAKFTFSIYDFDGTGTVDSYYLGQVLRALDLTPSLVVISNLGGTKRKGERSLKVEEFLSIYADAKKNKDFGTIDDFMECLRSNDKEGDGKISSDQLGHILQAYGERLDPEEVDEIIKDCGNLEDGFLSYVPFLKNLMNGTMAEQTSSSHANKKSPIKPETEDEISNMTANLNVLSSPKSPTTAEPPTDASAAFTVKVPKQKRPSVSDEVKALPEVANAAFTLKTTKPRSASVTEDTKAAAAAAATAALKPKNQMPLISMKTKGLIGHMSK